MFLMGYFAGGLGELMAEVIDVDSHDVAGSGGGISAPGRLRGKRGRPQAETRKFFVTCLAPPDAKADGKTRYCCCRFCSAVVKGEVDRMDSHLRSCPVLCGLKACPEDSVDLFREATSTFLTRRKIQRTGTIDAFVCERRRYTDAEIKAVRVEAARMCFLDNRPFRLWDTPSGKRFWVAAFGDAIPRPTRQQMATTLLDEEYESAVKSLEIALGNAQAVQLASDGWSDRSQRNMLAVMVLTPSPYFYRSFDTTLQTNTSHVIAEEMLAVIAEVGPAKVVAWVTDNEPKMCAAWTIVRERHSHIVCYGCTSHALHLVVSDVISGKAFGDLVRDARKVVTASELKHWKQALIEAGASTLVRDCPTRWGTTVDMLESLMKNKVSLQSVSVALGSLRGGVTPDEAAALHFLANPDSFASVGDLVAVLKPICEAITFLEGDESTLCAVYDVLSGTYDRICTVDVSAEIRNHVEVSFMNRYRFLYHPTLVLAAFLTPARMANGNRHYAFPEGWIRELLVAAREILPEAAEAAVQTDLNDYRSRRPGTVFAELSYDVEAASFWAEDGFVDISCPVLARLARRVISLAASSASVERLFSEQGRLDDPVRNRLSTEKRNKLAFLHQLGALRSRETEISKWDLPERDAPVVGLPVPPSQSRTKSAWERAHRSPPRRNSSSAARRPAHQSKEALEYVGQQRRKAFGDFTFVGTVVEYVPREESDTGNPLVVVLYDDGDKETMYVHEFEALDAVD